VSKFDTRHEPGITKAKDAFFFATREIGNLVLIEQPTKQAEGELPEFGFSLVDRIDSARFFDQTEQTVIYFTGGGSATIDNETAPRLKFFPEVTSA
jgi:hypothetical protein